MRFSILAALALFTVCSSARLADLPTPRPVPPHSCLVVGFLGGNDRWDDPGKGVRQLALRLRGRDAVFAETFENRRLDLALAFLDEALDADGDGRIEADEAGRVKLVVYGQSLGGWATVLFARLLEDRKIPIDLTIQIDSVGVDDDTIPPNVRYAANLYQDEGLFISGEHPVEAAKPESTRVVGNWEFEYDRPPGSRIRVDDLPWYKTFLRADHARMDRDPRVWQTVERLVLGACDGEKLDTTPSLVEVVPESAP